MTSISLHPTPAWRVVAQEQLHAVGIALRKEGIFFLAMLGVIATLVIVAAVDAAGQPNRNMSLGYAPGAAIPIVLVGLLTPFGVWRSEDPTRRAYHWAMPVARGPHTLAKTLAGWCWLTGAVAVFLLFLAALGTVVGAITGDYPRGAPAWQWAIPFTAASVGYLLTSTAVVGTEHPWRWIGGLVLALVVGRAFADALDLTAAARALDSVMNGYYGLEAALFGHIRATDPVAGGRAQPSTARWLSATLLWGAIGALGVGLAAYRRGRDG